MRLRRGRPLFLRTALLGVLCWLSSSSAPAKAVPNGGWDPRWSPDGKRIAFLSQRVGEPPNLWVISPSGAGARQLTTRGVRSFRWSPDSTSLLARTWLGTGLSWCRVVVASGSVGAMWPWLSAEAADPVPSPDGAFVAYLLKSGQWQDLWIARRDGAARVRVTARNFVQHPEWSPDGRRVAFEAANPHIGWQTQVWVYDRTQRSTVHMQGIGTALHGWSRDGSRLAFSLAKPPSDFLLGICDVVAGKAEPVSKAVHTGEGVAWARDGRSLAVTMKRGEGSQICVLRTTGTIERRIGDATLMARFPQVSPDGKLIAFEGQEKGKSFGSEVWVAQADGGSVQRLTPSYAADWAPCPSPDGTRVAFLSTRHRRTELWTADRTGGKPRRLVQADAGARLVWSPDASSLLVLQPAGSMLLPFSARGAARPLRIRPVVPYAAWSPDGRGFVFTGVVQHRPTLLFYDIRANTAKPLLKVEAQRTPADSFACWAQSGGHRLAFIRGQEVWLANQDGTAARRVAALGGKGPVELCDLRWSPTGTQLLVSYAHGTGTAMVFEIGVVSAAGRLSSLVREPVRSDFLARLAAYTFPPIWTGAGNVVFSTERSGTPQIRGIGLSAPRSIALVADGSTHPALLSRERLLSVAPIGAQVTIWSTDLRSHARTVWVKAQ